MEYKYIFVSKNNKYEYWKKEDFPERLPEDIYDDYDSKWSCEIDEFRLDEYLHLLNKYYYYKSLYEIDPYTSINDYYYEKMMDYDRKMDLFLNNLL